MYPARKLTAGRERLRYREVCIRVACEGDALARRLLIIDRRSRVLFWPSRSFAISLEKMPSIFRLFTAGLALLSALQQSAQATGSRRGQKENIVVIMTDDQDARLGSLDVQTYVQRELIAKGLSLTNHFATVAQCCPSRTSWLRGQVSSLAD